MVSTLAPPTDAERRLTRLDILIEQDGRSTTPPSAPSEVCDEHPVKGPLRPIVARFHRAGDVSDNFLHELKRQVRENGGAR